MAKLYPPYIGEVLPAFTGNKITIPFQMNRAVSTGEISGFYLVLRDLQGKELTNVILDKIDNHFITYELNFFLKNIDFLKIGQFYKVQIGYKDISGNLGHLSNTSIIKYTQTPRVYIENLSQGNNSYNNNYIGVYIPPEEDKNEKLYSGWLEVYNTKYELIYKTKEVIYNNLMHKDQEYTIHFENELGILEEDYYLYFVTRSVNNIISKSEKYFIEIKNQATSNTADKFIINTNLNREEGYIDINITTDFDSDNTNIDTEYFVLLRKEKNEKEWKEIKKFEIVVNTGNNINFSLKDYLVEQGKIYQYGIQQYNLHGIRSAIVKKNENEVHVDFEHIFLFDGKKQLKVKYNPQISSFKTTRQEQKQDTLGSQYPVIFRNNLLKYKEFTINGLISWTIDDEKMFLGDNYDDILTYSGNRQNIPMNKVNRSFNFIDPFNNVFLEREFKLKIEEWLSNGKPKLFKSAQEGNYIIYLSNVSLTPNEQLGRTIHSFSATAYEIDAYNYFNCLKYNFLPEYNTPFKVNPKDMIGAVNFNTIKLYELSENLCTNPTENIYTLNLGERQNQYLKLNYFEFNGLTPGDIIILDGVPQVINYTGNYTSSVIPKIIQIKPSANQKGLFYYSYYATSYSQFNQLRDTELNRFKVNQLGWREIELFNTTFIQDINEENKNTLKILDPILFSDKWEMGELYSLRFFKKEIINVYNKTSIETIEESPYEIKDFELYYDKEYTKPLDLEIVNKWYLYHIFDQEMNETEFYIDGANYLIYKCSGTKDLFKAKLPCFQELPCDDNHTIDLTIIGSYELEDKQIDLFSKDGSNWKDIQIGLGIICDIAFSQIIKTATFEDKIVFNTTKRQIEINQKYLKRTFEVNTSTKNRYNIEKRLVDSYLAYLEIFEIEQNKEEKETVQNE